MQIVEFSQDNVIVAEARGRIDTATSNTLRDRVVGLMTGSVGVVLLDMSNITYISSAGFRALLVIGKQSKTSDCRFGLCSLNEEVLRLFEISGFDNLFEIFPTRHEGIAHLSPP